MQESTRGRPGPSAPDAERARVTYGPGGLKAALAVLAVIAALCWQLTPTGAQPSCRFVLGFAALRDLVGPEKVGQCLEDERFNAENGNAEQRTTGGLLVWRKADNFTAFTDGATTWINGPNGLQSRPNSERFSWESDPIRPTPAASPPARPSAPAAPPSPRPAAVPPSPAPAAAPPPPAAPSPVPRVTPTTVSPPTGAAATPSSADEAEVVATAGGIPPVRGECPASHPVKGATSAAGEKIYYEPDRPEYASVTPEICFIAGGDARAAGYISSKR